MDKTRLTELVNLYLLDKITDREGAELAILLQSTDHQAEFNRLVDEQLENRVFDLEAPPTGAYSRIQAYLDRELAADRQTGAPARASSRTVHRVHFLRRPFWRYAAAVLVVAVGIYLYQRSGTPALLSQEKRFKNDLQPGAHQGTLTLPDGSSVVLSDTFAMAPNPKYAGTASMAKLTTRRGETILVRLSDGTRVWLNSSSSLSYPAVFSGDRRQVELSGEAYFEVKHETARPFSVKLPDGSLVKDIGTRFNIHAYVDEPVIKTTLLEGAVQVEAGGKELLLQPGQQAEHAAGKDLMVQEVPNLQNTVAWKDDEFRLEATNIQTIMLQVEKWYNAEIVYQDAMQNDTTEFFGSLPRNVPVTQLLKVLESTGHVHFTIEGKKITVMR